MQHKVKARAQPGLRRPFSTDALIGVQDRVDLHERAARQARHADRGARGYGSRTYCAMISFTRAKCARSVRYTVMRTA